MSILKNNFKKSKEADRELIERVLLVLLILTVTLLLYSSFNRNTGDITKKDPNTATIYTENKEIALEKEMNEREK